MRMTLAGVLAVLLALQPGLASAARVLVRTAVPKTPVPSLHIGGPQTKLSAPLTLNSLAPTLALPNATLPSLTPLKNAALAGAPQGVAPKQTVAHSPAQPLAATQTPSAAMAETPATKPTLSKKISALRKQTTLAVKGLTRLPALGQKAAAGKQFSALLGQQTRAHNAPVTAVAATGLGQLHPAAQLQHRPWSGNPTPGAEPNKPAPKKSRFKVFRDPDRNKAFWRMFLGEQIYMFGFQMYIVALPYLMKSFTKNTLAEGDQLRDTTAEALNQLVRENRSLARIAHWASQAVAYMAIPIFTRDGKAGPRKWLVRTALLRGLVLAGVPAIFFASGLVSGQVALYILLGLIGLQSFFQGIYVTMMSGSTARIMGHSSVLPSERMRANALRTFASAMMAILAPALAGKLMLGLDGIWKAGSGSAFIYGIYAGSVALAGLVFATIRMLAGPTPNTSGNASVRPEDGGRSSKFKLSSIFTGIFTSMWAGIKLIRKNRFLLTLLAMNLISSMFADPLVFNVLPEFVEGIMGSNSAVIDGLLKIPVLGWFLDGLVSTPMGFFALLITFSSLGSAAASALANPMRRFFSRWFKTEESLTIPFYIFAFLQVPAFWWMTSIGSFWGVLLLYAAQTFVAGFVGLTLTGIYQKKLRRYDDTQMNQVLAANSFVSILAAIAATYLYGFVLTDIPIATSLLIAAAATTALGLLRLAAPWLMFTKAERKGSMSSHYPGEKPDQFPQNPNGSEHLPNTNGPLSIGL
jgi:hypothetical protein